MTSYEFVEQLFAGVQYVEHDDQVWYDGETICKRLNLKPAYLALLEEDVESLRLIDFGQVTPEEVATFLDLIRELPIEEQREWIFENGQCRYFVNLLGLHKLIDWSGGDFHKHLQLWYRMKKMGRTEN
ncbi:MAG: hypothetical protein RML72_10235 [Bacteroidia bacterium]|nr:hypothetical protein [Bacteroidia bacterium]MDW8159236.1 hypothetical protein [Bacteroidia bacterium]